jgi:hypothetical protein
MAPRDPTPWDHSSTSVFPHGSLCMAPRDAPHLAALTLFFTGHPLRHQLPSSNPGAGFSRVAMSITYRRNTCLFVLVGHTVRMMCTRDLEMGNELATSHS